MIISTDYDLSSSVLCRKFVREGQNKHHTNYSPHRSDCEGHASIQLEFSAMTSIHTLKNNSKRITASTNFRGNDYRINKRDSRLLICADLISSYLKS